MNLKGFSLAASMLWGFMGESSRRDKRMFIYIVLELIEHIQSSFDTSICHTFIGIFYYSIFLQIYAQQRGEELLKKKYADTKARLF